jgi:hypothetical protein
VLLSLALAACSGGTTSAAPETTAAPVQGQEAVLGQQPAQNARDAADKANQQIGDVQQQLDEAAGDQ